MSKLLELEYELIDILRARANLVLCFLRLRLHLLELGLQLSNLAILLPDLSLFHLEHTLHILVLVFQSYDR